MTIKKAIAILKQDIYLDKQGMTYSHNAVGIEALEMAIKTLEQEPKTGHWIEKDGFDGDVYYDCSECGESWTTIEGTPWDNEWKYCPNCGAKMESEG